MGLIPAIPAALAAHGSENRIAEARDRAGLRQADLAKRVGMSRGQLGNIESGTRKVDLPELREIARALNCTIVDLLLPEDAPDLPTVDERVVLAELRGLGAQDARAVMAAVRGMVQALAAYKGAGSAPKALEGDAELARKLAGVWRDMDDHDRRNALDLLEGARAFRRR